MATASEGPLIQGRESPDVSGEGQVPLPRIHWRAADPNLRYQFWSLCNQYSGLLLTILGFVALIYSVNSNTKSIRMNVQNSVLTHVLSLDKFFIERPELYPYFYGSKAINPTDHDYAKVLATAQMVADILDLVSDQNGRFQDQWEDPQAWDAWIRDSLKESPILVQYLRDNRKWYGHSLMEKVDETKS